METVPLGYVPATDLLSGRVILVTGAGDGLGRAAAIAFARHGANVILLGRTQRKLEAVYDQIESEGLPFPLLMPADLAQTGLADYEQIATAITSQFGRLDGLLHSAAILGNLSPLSHYDLGVWTQVMQVNLNAPYLLTRACLDCLSRSEDASVVFTVSDVARAGRAYWGAYAAAGAAIENLARVWASELREVTTIRVNTIDPGPVKTGLRSRAYPAEDPGHLPEPNTVMTDYLFLIGPDSRDVTGRTFTRIRTDRPPTHDQKK